MAQSHLPDLNAVLGSDEALRAEWGKLPGAVQLRILESGMSISTLGELRMIRDQLCPEGQ